MKKKEFLKRQLNLDLTTTMQRLLELDVEKHIKNPEVLLDLSNIKCCVPISGGKDSQSCLKKALEVFHKDEILGVFCDTQYEHPLTYKHIERMKEMYGVTIVHLNDGGVYERIEKYKRFPSDIARFCTDQLKIRVAKMFYNNLSLAQESGFEVWYGMRLGESFQRSERYKDKTPHELYAPHTIMINKYPKYLEKQGVMFKLPILDWEEEDVFEYLNGEENELYSLGFERVGCFPCLAAGDKYKEKAFALDDVGKQRRIDVIQLGHEIGKNVFTTKGGRLRNPDADIDNVLDIDYNPNNEELAPCFHCNI